MVSESAKKLVQSLASNAEEGLSSEDAAQRLARDGKNVLQMAPPIPWWVRFVAQFESLMVGLLIAAAILSGFLGDWIDTVAILAIVILNAALGFLQEERAYQAIRALRDLSAPHAKVVRDDKLQVVAASDIVVGDLFQLEAGDRVPADARLIEAFNLQAQEASLTGESIPIAKDAAADLADDTPVSDRVNSVFLGTSVVAGKALGVVTAIGMKTEIGHIARLLDETRQEQTPLQKRLTQLGQILVAACLIIVAIIFVIQWLRGGKITEVFLTSVSLAVAAIPEGLPAVVTVTLAIGLQRMAKRNALIRKLPSVETLGCVTVICSDKTGTLTRNEMTVRRLWVFDAAWRVEGEGYAPDGGIFPIQTEDLDSDAPDSDAPDIDEPARSLPSAAPTSPPALERMLSCADQCNEATWNYDHESHKLEMIGDPTEIALKVVVAKAKGTHIQPYDSVLHENPFDSERKRMSRVVRYCNDELQMLVKGAPESVLAAATQIFIDGEVVPLTDAHRQCISARNAWMASQALRVLGFAFRRVDHSPEQWHREEELVFLGLIGMIDPPRRSVTDAVASCRRAGIRPVMITGDHPQTALAIARAVGIAGDQEKVLLGTAIVQMSDDELTQHVTQSSVIARVSPLDKLRIVQAWKRNDHVVAMTGDGVNDAPAVKTADIGIVMGITGTDVAKEAADMILTDDNFVSIVNAIEEGRGIYDNIQKSLHYLLACNSSEVLFMFVASLIGWPSPLLAIQILWINLVTDGFPALALASEPLGENLMNRPPRPMKEPVLTFERGRSILLHGLLMASVCLIGFGWVYMSDPERLAESRAIAFSILVFSQIFYAMGCRDSERNAFSIGIFKNHLLIAAALGSILLHFIVMSIPWTAEILGLAAMPWRDLPWVIALSLIPVSFVELRKYFFARQTVTADQATDVPSNAA